MSGAIPQTEKEQLMEKVDTLLKAVKQAREEANTTEESDYPRVAEQVFGFLF